MNSKYTLLLKEFFPFIYFKTRQNGRYSSQMPVTARVWQDLNCELRSQSRSPRCVLGSQALEPTAAASRI